MPAWLEVTASLLFAVIGSAVYGAFVTLFSYRALERYGEMDARSLAAALGASSTAAMASALLESTGVLAEHVMTACSVFLYVLWWLRVYGGEWGGGG